jgi:hypothetical protein
VLPAAHAAVRPLPDDADIRVFATRSPGKLQMLVRAPLAVARSAQLPHTGDSGMLDRNALAPMLPGIARQWIVPEIDVFDDGVLVRPQVSAARVAASADRSFAAYEDAGVSKDAAVAEDGAWLDAALEYPLPAPGGAISVHPKFNSLAARVSVSMTYAAGGSSRQFDFRGDPGRIYMEPRVRDAAAQFLAHGLTFVLHSADLLLFLFCLILPLRGTVEILPADVSFIGAFCLAMAARPAGFAPDANWFVSSIETLSALAILLAALANILGNVTRSRRALFALLCGLIFGYAGANDLTAKLQFAGPHPVIGRAAFAFGAAFASEIAAGIIAAALAIVFRFAGRRRIEIIIVSALAADTAWGWLAERWDRLRLFPFQVPAFDAALLASALRWLMAAVLLGGLLWLVDGWLKPEKSE